MGRRGQCDRPAGAGWHSRHLLRVPERQPDEGQDPGGLHQHPPAVGVRDHGLGAGDRRPATAPPSRTVAVPTGGQSNVQPIWEAGRRLALLSPGATCESSNTWPKAGNLTESGRNCRRILTWADINNDGLVGGTERLEFTKAGTNTFTLCSYLGARTIVYLNSPNTADIVASDNNTDLNVTDCLGQVKTICTQ